MRTAWYGRRRSASAFESSAMRIAALLLLLGGAAPLVAQSTAPASRPFLTVQRAECSSLLGKPLFAHAPGARPALEAALAKARSEADAAPDDLEKAIWVGRRLGYLWRVNEAIAVYDRALERWPNSAALLRHRGHRLISIRRFDDAIANLTRAAELMGEEADAIEPDGQPNARNLPLTTLGFNVHYHLGLARYFNGDFPGAVSAMQSTLRYAEKHADNRVAASYWQYLALRRSGRDAEAARLVAGITPEMEIIENDAYHRLLLVFNGTRTVEETLEAEQKAATDAATIGYGIGIWRLLSGDRAAAVAQFERVVAGENWPAFGFIAAEVELHRVRGD